MYSAKDLSQLEPEERSRIFVRLAEMKHGSRFKAALADEIGVSRVTIRNWLQEHRVPVMAILLLQEWTAPPETFKPWEVRAEIIRIAQLAETQLEARKEFDRSQLGAMDDLIGRIISRLPSAP